MCFARGKEDEQQDAGRGKRQKQAPDPLSNDPLCSPLETGALAGPFLLLLCSFSAASLLLLCSSPALVQQVAAVSSFAVAACFFKPSCRNPFSHLNVSFCLTVPHRSQRSSIGPG